MKKIIAITSLMLISIGFSFSQDDEKWKGYAWAYGYGKTVEEAKKDAVMIMFSQYNAKLAVETEQVKTQTDKKIANIFGEAVELSIDSMLNFKMLEFRIDQLTPEVYKVWCGIHLDEILSGTMKKLEKYYVKRVVTTTTKGWAEQGVSVNVIYNQDFNNQVRREGYDNFHSLLMKIFKTTLKLTGRSQDDYFPTSNYNILSKRVIGMNVTQIMEFIHFRVMLGLESYTYSEIDNPKYYE